MVKPVSKVFMGIAAGIAFTVSFVSLVLVIYTIGPAIETRLFPVVEKLHILKVEAIPDDPDRTRISGFFTKVRGCDYIGIAWFRGTKATKFERVSVVLHREEGDTSSPNRPVGTQSAGPWTIGLPPEELEQDSFAQLFHHCHPFWTTVTEFYP